MQHSANDFLRAFVDLRQAQGFTLTSCADEIEMNLSLLRNFITGRAEAHWHQAFVTKAMANLKAEATLLNKALNMEAKT